MTVGDGLVIFGFVAVFGLLVFFVGRSLKLDAHLRAHHNETWRKLHRFSPRAAIFAFRFFALFGWRKLGSDPKLRSYLRDMAVVYAISLGLIVVIVAVGATFPLKVFRYIPAEGGIGGEVVLDPGRN